MNRREGGPATITPIWWMREIEKRTREGKMRVRVRRSVCWSSLTIVESWSRWWMDPICRTTVRFARVAGSPHGHESLATGSAITIIAVIHVCVTRTRLTAAIVDARRNVHVALARPSKMQLPYLVEAEVSRLPANAHKLCSYGSAPLSFHDTGRKQRCTHVVGCGMICFP